MIPNEVRESLIHQYLENPIKHVDNVNILWEDIGHIITSSFFKKWEKWSLMGNFLWEDSKQDLKIGFVHAMNSYKLENNYEVGKWLYMKSISYASGRIIKLLSVKNSILSQKANSNDNTVFFETENYCTEDLNDQIIDKIDQEEKLYLINEAIEKLLEDDKNKIRVEAFMMSLDGKKIKTIAEELLLEIYDVKNALFFVKSKIKEYVKKKVK